MTMKPCGDIASHLPHTWLYENSGATTWEAHCPGENVCWSCGEIIEIMIFRGTRSCSVNCQKAWLAMPTLDAQVAHLQKLGFMESEHDLRQLVDPTAPMRSYYTQEVAQSLGMIGDM